MARKNSKLVLASLSLLIIVTVLIMNMLNAGVVKAQGGCTDETIKGTYLFQGLGTTVSDGAVRPYAEAGTWTLDGKGNATGIISASIDGVSFATEQAFTATYKHVGNCVFAVVDEFGLKVDLYTTPTGTPMTYYSPGFSGIQLKQ